MKGRTVLFWFYGVMLFLTVTMFLLIKSAVNGTPDERAQRDLARTLPSMYQKYFIDNGQWPESPKEAAIHFRSENPAFVEKVQSAESKWGLKAVVSEPAAETSKLQISYDQPRKQVLNFVLEKHRS